jgi:CheY-like chemotaxis protein
MLSAELFADHVHDALAHLYDRLHLRAHPLASLLADKRSLSEDELRRLLLDAVESLQPPQPCPPSSPASRRYRYLELRYLKGATPEQTAQALQISVRQSQRERERALDAVASVLWERYNRLTAGRMTASSASAGEAFNAPRKIAESDIAVVGVAKAESAHDDLSEFGSLPSTEPVSLTDALRDALDIVARLLEDRGARVDVVLPDRLPLVRVHRLVLRQVLIDLLESAIESQVHAQIQVSAAVLAERLSLDLAVLGPRTRTVMATPEIDARLAATGKLIELQAGQLRVERSDLLPFRAMLLLPLARAKTLLVIDDNPDVAFLFSRLLRDHDYRVLQASTSRTALQLAREARPDAITLDVLMPAQDGWDLLRSLNQDPTVDHIPVIICSVLPERSLALSLGVAEFLNKPVTQEALLAALDRCVGTERGGDQRIEAGA